MFRTILPIFAILGVLCSFVANAIAEDENNTFTIVAPKQNESLLGIPVVHIAWTTDLGEGFIYSISFSLDGKVFDIPIASGLSCTEYDWKSNALIGSVGWIKVKMMDYNGMPMGENTVAINWIPDNAIVVSKANQRVYRFMDGKLKYTFVCSTALPQFDGTEGEYRVISRELKHWSKKYELWMPYSVFFFEGYALHATTEVRHLGSAASHGCVRLRPRDAKTLYNDVSIGDKVIVLPPNVDVGYLSKLMTSATIKPVIQTAKG